MDIQASASSSTLPPHSSWPSDDVERAFHDVHRALSPRIAILCSPDVDEVLQPNHFNDFAECIRPFEDSLQGVTVRTSQLESKQCPTFPVRFDPLAAFALQRRTSLDENYATDERDVRPEEILDRINAYVTVHSKGWDAMASGFHISSEEDAKRIRETSLEKLTPWFCRGRDVVLENRSISRHETFGHPVGVLLAVSSRSPDPLNAFASLYAATQPQTCDAFVSRPYVDPHVMRYYVLIHDYAQGGDVEESKQILESVKKIYGLNCCILPLNSASPEGKAARFTGSIWSESSSAARAIVVSQEQDNDSSPSPSERGTFFSEDDIKRLSGLVREMVAQSLIPWMERCVMQWNDSIAASRKGLTGRLFGAGKKFFGGSTIARPGSAASDKPSWDAQASCYAFAAIEAQTRRLADFAFVIRDYKLAAAMYDIGRKDYANDKAYHYAAGATEMFGLSHLMIMLSFSSPPIDVDSYLASACALYRMPIAKASSGALLRPLRATLLYYAAYRALNFYRSVPHALIRAAQDPGADLDVMGAMLIEQAAIADLRAFDRPALRKWALHLVMAGHRYQQCGAKLLSLRCFSAASIIYCQRKTSEKMFLDEKTLSEDNGSDADSEDVLEGWTMIEAHVEHELGQQALNDGQTEQAIQHFLRTIRPARSDYVQDATSAASRTALHERYLHDLAAVFDSLEPHIGDAPPTRSFFDFFDAKHSRFQLEGEQSSREEEEKWEGFQAHIDANAAPASEETLLKPDLDPNVVTMGVPIQLSLRIVNPLSTSLAISDIEVVFMEESLPSPSIAGKDAIEHDAIESMVLDPLEIRDVSVTLNAFALGRFRAAAVNFRLGHMPVFSQGLRKEGRRLNATTEQRTSRKPFYGTDETLAVTVKEAVPIIEAGLVDCPPRIGFGEEVEVTLRLLNRGIVAADGGVRLYVDKPGMIALQAGAQEAASSYTAVNNLLPAGPITLLSVDEVLEAGQAIDRVLRVRGGTLGQSVLIRLLLIAGATESRVRSRLSQTIEVYPIIDLSVEVNPAARAFAYDVAITATNIHPEGAPIRINHIAFVSPRWISSEKGDATSPSSTDPQALLTLQPNTPVTTYTTLREGVEDDGQRGSAVMLNYTIQHLAALLRGRDIDRNSRAEQCTLCISSTTSGPQKQLASSFLSIARTLWRRTNLGNHFPTISQADRDRIFTLYMPDDLDVLVNWETLDGSHSGQNFILGLALGPKRDVVRDILSSLGGEAGAGGRNLYEEAAREKAALMSNLTHSYLGNEEDPLFVDIDTSRLQDDDDDNDAMARDLIRVVFIVRNLSTCRLARCIINLDSSVDANSNSNRGQGQQDDSRTAPLPTASWIGRLTLRSPLIPPRGTVELNAYARRPRMGQDCELGDWSIKSEVLDQTGKGQREGGGDEDAEVLKRFSSGRLKSGTVV